MRLGQLSFILFWLVRHLLHNIVPLKQICDFVHANSMCFRITCSKSLAALKERRQDKPLAYLTSLFQSYLKYNTSEGWKATSGQSEKNQTSSEVDQGHTTCSAASLGQCQIEIWGTGSEKALWVSQLLLSIIPLVFTLPEGCSGLVLDCYFSSEQSPLWSSVIIGVLRILSLYCRCMLNILSLQSRSDHR